MFPIGTPGFTGDPTFLLAYHYWFNRWLLEAPPEQQDSALLAHIYVFAGMLKDPANRLTLQSAVAAILTKTPSVETPPAAPPPAEAIQPGVSMHIVANTPVLAQAGDEFTVSWGAGPMPVPGGYLMVNVWGPWLPDGITSAPDFTQAGSTSALTFPEVTPIPAGMSAGELHVVRGSDSMSPGIYKLGLTVGTFQGDERYVTFEVTG